MKRQRFSFRSFSRGNSKRSRPYLSQVGSRKLHGSTPFDITLPLTGNPGIECRSGGAANDYQAVLTFPSAVTFTNAAITAARDQLAAAAAAEQSVLRSTLLE